MKISKLMLIAGAAGGLMLTACDMKDPAPVTTPPPKATVPSKPDNTGANKRDASGETKTPMDQSNSQSDLDITASVRRAIMDDKSMSTNAQNCKIITDKGVVTLRGVVDTAAERDAIGKKATAVAGVSRVDNLLEVKVGG